MTADTLQVVYQRPDALTQAVTHYCPGCTHGVIHRLVAEVLDELDIRDKTIGVASVGCSVFAYNYFNTDFAQAPHGRAPAMATGIKRVHPNSVVFTYQGDGDLASIGIAEIIHAAARGENITVIFVNNAVYGMTGGQMAPTTLPGMCTTSSTLGRNVATMGYPLRVSELLANLEGVSYVVRRSVHDPGNINKTKKAIKTAFRAQLIGKGLALVEILSSCPVNWGIEPPEALKFIKEKMIPYFPLGDFKVDVELKALE
ncbi:thiamine pyrophosphate-dependent enzyme [Candidatus Chlorohelix sp.]|uniref:thiamine pyrophosphate-dependent enzyme n=1 Tax=Candidatus Chlorohelix sp. TaxID=3139201 RepID=UPI0030340C4B